MDKKIKSNHRYLYFLTSGEVKLFEEISDTYIKTLNV